MFPGLSEVDTMSSLSYYLLYFWGRISHQAHLLGWPWALGISIPISPVLGYRWPPAHWGPKLSPLSLQSKPFIHWAICTAEEPVLVLHSYFSHLGFILKVFLSKHLSLKWNQNSTHHDLDSGKAKHILGFRMDDYTDFETSCLLLCSHRELGCLKLCLITSLGGVWMHCGKSRLKQML